MISKHCSILFCNLGLDGGGRALDFPQVRVPYHLLRLEGEGGRWVGEKEGNGRGIEGGEEVEIFE